VNAALPNATVVRACWWVEDPLNISLQEELRDDFLVPPVNSISQLLFAPHKVAAIVWSDRSVLAAPCGDKMTHGAYEGVCKLP